MAAQAYKLGRGAGAIIDNGDGTASYRNFTQIFRVRIADVTGFSFGRDGSTTVLTLRILGYGTQLASLNVGTIAAEKIEEWFRAHPDFGRNTPAAHAPAFPQLDGRLIADELTKLAGLRDSGVLTTEEFAAQKAKLLG